MEVPQQAHIAVALPVLRMERDVGEHIDGRLEHIEAFVCSHMVKTVAGIAALHIEPEGFSVAVGTPFVGVTRDAFLICAHKYCIVVFRIFVQEPFPGEVGYHTSVNVPMLHQIGIDLRISEWTAAGQRALAAPPPALRQRGRWYPLLRPAAWSPLRDS